MTTPPVTYLDARRGRETDEMPEEGVMSHTMDCKRTRQPHNPDARCDCFEPDTDWAPDQPCGGIGKSVNGGPMSEPPWCEVHMKPWGHRRPKTTPTPAAHPRRETEVNGETQP